MVSGIWCYVIYFAEDERRNSAELLFFAELDNEVRDQFVSTEGISRWFTLSELSELEMPYVIEHYLKINTNCQTKL